MSLKTKRRLALLPSTILLVVLYLLIITDFTNDKNNNNVLWPSTIILSANALNTILGGITKAGRVGRVSAGDTMDISALGIGTWSWGNRFLFDYNPQQDEELYEAYKLLRNAGVSLFDTADSYGTLDLNGRAEILLGQFERRYKQDIGLSDEMIETTKSAMPPWWDLGGKNKSSYQPQQVASKLAPYPWRVTSSQVVQAAKGSLRRLEQPKLSIAQLHWSTANYQRFQERALWEGICTVYNEGLCDAIGVSNYGPKQLNKISSYIQQEYNNEVPLAIAQIQYSLMTYGQELTQDMNDVCDDTNCRLISYSPLCLGLLTGKYTLDNLPKSKARQQLFRELLPGAQNLLNTLEVVAKEYDKTQSQVAINWCICKGTVPIPGARNVQQATENLASATGWSLKPDAVEVLDIASKQVSKPMIQNIFQTK
jgi:pyridoxine 4-dehydrogenase